MSNTISQPTDADQRSERKLLAGESLQAFQLQRLNDLFASILPQNQFYSKKFQCRSPLKLGHFHELSNLPVTTKQELVVEQDAAGLAANLTFPVDQYSRFHRTSGTRGRPMVVLDTEQDWNWWMEVWQYVLDSAALDASDRVLMAFSFGPFIGFWSAFDAAVRRRALVVPTGAMSSLARLELAQSIRATVLFCTPSYALHLAEVAREHHIDLASTAVSRIVVAGEPGGSLPQVRERIESTWQATVIDHSGASEVGPWGFADHQHRGVHVNEAEFIAEFIPVGSDSDGDVKSLEPDEIEDGATYELLLTSLGRLGSPVIRYRTGDLVRPMWPDGDQPCRFVLLDGGVLGRADDMMIIRGVNVFPTSVEQILRSFPEVDEYRMTAYRQGAMDQLKIDVEDRAGDVRRIEQELQIRLGFRVEVTNVDPGSLPRFEAKGKRFVDQRQTN
jgi:phenylacetate-CoA ligase